MRYQFTQGSLVTITVTTLDQYGHAVPPDNLVPPTYNNFFESPNGQIQIATNMLTTPITPTFFYANIDSTFLSVGSYTVVFTWTINGVVNTVTTNFDILVFDGATLLPIDPISRLRLRLKDNDIDPTRWVWSDQELSEYLQDALNDLNSAPPLSNWFWFNVPLQYVQNILLAAEAIAMQAQAIKLSHSPIVYNDKGVQVDMKGQAQTYQSISNILRDKADAERLRIKRTSSLAYRTGYIVGGAGSPYLSVPPIRAAGRGWGGL
jgi:hypothetical protein